MRLINQVVDIGIVTSFLKTIRKEIKRGHRFFIGYRSISSNGKIVNAKQGLLDIGIVKASDIWKYIFELEPNECFRIGFDYDKSRDMNSELFEFIKKINKKNVYIKLFLNSRGVVCLSFHISNR